MRMRRFFAVFLTAVFIVTGIIIFPGQKVLAYSDEEAYWRSFSTDYYYEKLTGREKKLYERLDKACMDFLLDKKEAQIDKYTPIYQIRVDISDLKFSYANSSKADSDEYIAESVLELFFESNPQYFFITTYTELMYGDGVFSEMRLMIFQKFADKEVWEAEKAKVRSALDEYLSLVPENARPEEAEKIIHDKMCENISYIYSISVGGDQTIYEALVGKSTVCSGYALLFEALMNRLGIDCICCSGTDHRWNIIELHGQWYLVDVTNDDYNNSLTWYNCSENSYFTKANLFHESLIPKTPYDDYDQSRIYSSRYIEKDGNLYFVANDLNDENGFVVILVKGVKDEIPSEIALGGRTYKVLINEASNVAEKQTVSSTDTPTTTEVPSTKAPTSKPTATSTPAPVQTKSEGGTFEDFVERLYTVALNRSSEPEGKAFWCEHVGNSDLTGAACANEFLLSKEFKDRNLNDEEFLKVLYKTFFDRDAAKDPDGFNFWMNCLKSQGRDSVVDCFINSEEWCNVCASYGVRSGATRAKATVASSNATAFATRLYTKCLGRDPEEEGLKFWSLGLTNQELSGTQAAKEFFYCPEFVNAKYSDEEYINRMYETFMGREPEAEGKAYWLDLLSKGTSRDEVFNFFSTCPEFTEICKTYAIQR